jgi:hypothetical protein
VFDLDSKSAAEWKKRVEETREEGIDKLSRLQIELDESRHAQKLYKRDSERLGYILTHVLDYFLNERRLTIPERDLDLFYLEDILEKFHKEKGSDGEE